MANSRSSSYLRGFHFGFRAEPPLNTRFSLRPRKAISVALDDQCVCLGPRFHALTRGGNARALRSEAATKEHFSKMESHFRRHARRSLVLQRLASLCTKARFGWTVKPHPRSLFDTCFIGNAEAALLFFPSAAVRTIS
jgi:hypothetical protein